MEDFTKSDPAAGGTNEAGWFALKRFRPAFAEAATRRQVQGFSSVPARSVLAVYCNIWGNSHRGVGKVDADKAFSASLPDLGNPVRAAGYSGR